MNKNVCKICGKTFKHVHKHIVQKHKISVKEYLLQYNKNYPKCPICGIPVEYSRSGKYHKTCGKKSCVDKIRTSLIKQTCLEKYGKENYAQTKKWKEKVQQTCIDRYGVKSPLQSDEIKEKIKQTNLEKYGVDNPAKSGEIKEKAKQTCLEKYGVNNPMKSNKIREKMKQTCLEKYGIENYTQSNDYKEKAKQTCLEKYGVESYTQTYEYKEIVKQTCLEKYGKENYAQTDECKQIFLEKYGVDNPMKSNEIKDKIKQINLDKYGKEYYQQTDEYKERYKQTCMDKYGVEHYSQTEEYKKKAHQTKKKNKSYGNSKREDLCYNFIKENIDPDVQRQVFVNKWNIDFYLPKYDLYLQFDGDYWHGYTRSKEQLSKTEQGRHILKVMKHDKEQNEVIPNLIRIRESEFMKNNNILLERIL